MALCDKKDMFLFQALPDIFPQGRLTEVEVELWDRYFIERKNK